MGHNPKLGFRWDDAKDVQLRARGRPSFQAVLNSIEAGGLLDDLEHTSASYPGQRLMVVRVDGYVCCVPYRVEEDGKLLMITVIPSRKLQKRYGEKS